MGIKDKSALQKEDFPNADNNKYGEELRKQHLRGGYKVCYFFLFFYCNYNFIKPPVHF